MSPTATWQPNNDKWQSSLLCISWHHGKYPHPMFVPTHLAHNNHNVAMPCHTTPNDAANYNHEQHPTPTTTQNTLWPWLSNKWRQPPSTMLHKGQPAPMNGKANNKLRWVCSPPPPVIFLTWNSGATLLMAMWQWNNEQHSLFVCVLYLRMQRLVLPIPRLS